MAILKAIAGRPRDLGGFTVARLLPAPGFHMVGPFIFFDHLGPLELAPGIPRELDVRLCRIKEVRSFIDEIPTDHPTTDPIQPSCDFMCHLAELGLATAAE